MYQLIHVLCMCVRQKEGGARKALDRIFSAYVVRMFLLQNACHILIQRL